MSAYVDALLGGVERDARARRVGARNGHKWCHLFADTEAELHAFADLIGMKREWFQVSHYGTPHYDLTPGRRAVAVRHGAIELDRHAAVELARRLRPPPTNEGA